MADDNTARRYISRANPSLDIGPRASESDPLAELARLIGQTNPFEQPRAPRSNPRDDEWPGNPPPAPAQTYAQPSADPYRHAGQHDHQGYYDDPHQQAYSPPPTASQYVDQHQPYADEHQAHYDQHTDYGQGDAVAPYYGDNGQLMPDDPYAQQHYGYDEPAPRRRSGLITVAAVAGLALVGTGGAYAYRTFFSSSAPAVPPLIKAEGGPNKIVPAQQADTGANKQIYDRVGSGGQTEKIVSREEQPVPIQPANSRPAYVPSATGAPPPSAAAVASQMPNAWPSPPGATVQPASPGAPVQGAQGEPRRVRTVTIRPDQQGGMQQSAPTTQAAASSRNSATDLAPPSGSARVQQQAPARGSSSGPLSLTPDRTASADPRIGTRAPVQATASTGGGYVVQISAQKTEEDASAAFRSAQSRYPSLLGGRQLIVKRKDVPGKGTYYGAQVGPFASRDDANQLCASLKSAGGDCMVQKH